MNGQYETSGNHGGDDFVLVLAAHLELRGSVRIGVVLVSAARPMWVASQPFRKQKRSARVPGSCIALRRDDLRLRPALTSG